MTVPAGQSELRITSLGKKARLLESDIGKVELLGYKGQVKWRQEEDALVIQCPLEMPCATAIGFRISGNFRGVGL